MVVKMKMKDATKNIIDKGGHVRTSKDKKFKNVLIRVPIGMLDEIESWIESKPWLNRTQWILDAIHEKLLEKQNIF